MKINIVLPIVVLLFFSVSGCASSPVKNSGSKYSWSGMVDIRNSEQYIQVRTKDINNPILLYLHGGPGGAQTPLTSYYLSELEKYYTVVKWDQRGAGRSYKGEIPAEFQTIDSFVEDAKLLTEFLKNKFAQDKIFIFGNSWGSILGMFIIDKYPNDFHALVVDGVAVDMVNNWSYSYDLSWEKALENNNRFTLWRLNRIGRPGPGTNMDASSVHSKYYSFLVYDTRNSSRNYGLNYYIISSMSLLSWNYNPLLLMRRIQDSSSILMKELYTINMKEKVQVVEVPVYFMVGRHDFHTPYTLAEQYFDILEAPYKELIWFENSAHGPHIQENKKFVREMIRIKSDVLGFSYGSSGLMSMQYVEPY